MTEREMAQGISLNRMNVTQEWLDKAVQPEQAGCHH